MSIRRRMSGIVVLVCGVLLTGTALVTTAPTRAAAGAPIFSPVLPAARVLNPDGTLNLTQEVNGALDLAGWRVSLDPERGPVLAQAGGGAGRAAEVSSSASAAYQFSALGNGVDGHVIAVAIKGGEVYIGGHFTHLCGNAACSSGNIRVNHIAKWNGSSWSALGHGLDNSAMAFAFIGTDLYVGGAFKAVCGNAACSSNNATVNYIARWNGSAWSPLVKGIDDIVMTLAVGGSDLYVGGQFDHFCKDALCLNKTRVNHIVKWNGSSWSKLGHGVRSTVNDIAISGSDIYVVGGFWEFCGNAACNSGNTAVNKVGKWNGSVWSALGNGLRVTPWTVAVSGSDVYVGGAIQEACGNPACDAGNSTVNHIARWNGTSWSALDYGVNDSVSDLAVSGSGTNFTLFVGGHFTQVCGNGACDSGNVNAARIAKWNGNQWAAVAHGVSAAAFAFDIGGGAANKALVVGGTFEYACGSASCILNNTRVNHVARYALNQPTATPTATSSAPTATPTATSTVVCNAKPPKPTLKKPVNGAVVATNRPVLKWNAAACAATYKVIVKNAQTGLVADKVTNWTGLKYKTDALAGGVTYKWFVKGCNAFGCRKSAVRTFTVP